MDAAFSSLVYLFVLSARTCRFEVTVTSVSLFPFMSRRGLFNTNQRLSNTHRKLTLWASSWASLFPCLLPVLIHSSANLFAFSVPNTSNFTGQDDGHACVY